MAHVGALLIGNRTYTGDDSNNGTESPARESPVSILLLSQRSGQSMVSGAIGLTSSIGASRAPPDASQASYCASAATAMTSP